MRILYVGDVMGDVGIEVVEKVLPSLRLERKIDLVIAQAENLSEGKGIRLIDFRRLQKAGVDFCTGGNWTLFREDIIPILSNPAEPVIRPANYPVGTPGLGYKYINEVLVVSLLGKIVGKDSDKPVDNPLLSIDKILEKEKTTHKKAIVVNFHGDFSSEKVVIGHYLDGRAAMVVGDHWHVPTADARVLPSGTAHMTDAGMCGVLDASLGVTFESVIPRWRDNQQTRNILATSGPRQFNGLLAEVKDGLAVSAEHIQKII